MNLRILCIIFIAFCFFNTPYSIAQGWQWAKSTGGTNNESTAAVATNAAGNVYAAGSFFSGSVTFGSFTLNNTNNTYADVFITKCDPGGNVLWAKNFGGSDDDYATSIAIDAWGYIYVAGYFYSSSITLGTTTLNNDSSNTTNMFIVKYDSSGNLIWARQAGGTMDDRINAITTDAAGNVVVTGNFESKYLIFGTDTVKNPLIPTDAVFVIKYDSAGNYTWAKGTGPIGDGYGYAIAADAANNIFVAGKFNSPTINFGNSVVLSNSGSGFDDVFLVKYNASGTAQWAISPIGVSNNDVATALNTDATGNIYITGNYASDTLKFGSTNLINAGGYDIFVAKYNTTGHLVWAKDNGGAGGDYATAMSIDDSSNVYIAGNFGSTSLTFGSSTIINDSAGAYFLYIAKYDSLGNAQWANTTGGPGSNMNAMATDQMGNIYVGGDFSDSMFYFGTNILLNAVTTHTSDMFLAKYTQSAASVANTTQPGHHIILYPNPTDGMLNIVLNDEGYNSIGVYDCIGRAVYQSQLAGNEKNIKINTSGLKDGIYFLRAVRNDNVENATFVIRK